jgi:hypothetical protein
VIGSVLSIVETDEHTADLSRPFEPRREVTTFTVWKHADPGAAREESLPVTGAVVGAGVGALDKAPERNTLLETFGGG